MRDATLLRLIGEAETLLTQAETPNFIQAQSLVELLAKLRDADLRARARASARLNNLNAKLDAIIEAMNEDVAAGDRRDAVRAELSAALERVEHTLKAEAEKAEANIRTAEIIARVEQRLELQTALAAEQAEHAAQTRASIARIEATLSERSEGEAARHAQLDVIQRGFEGLHLDNVAKLQRDEALAQRVARLEAAMGDAQRGLQDLAGNPVNADARRRAAQDRAINALRESGRRDVLRRQLAETHGVPDRRCVFMLHKTASVFVWRVLEFVSNVAAVPLQSPTGLGEEYVPDEVRMRGKVELLRSRHGLFGPFRGFFDFPPDMFSRGVVVFRDPRDLLVSMYFSWAFSHQLRDDEATLVGSDGEVFNPTSEQRELWKAQGPDPFVLEYAAFVEGNVRRYLELLRSRKDFVALHYEDLIATPERWLEELLGGLGVEAEDASVLMPHLWTAFAGEFAPVSEDVNRHRRQMMPGDHVRKLKPETIAALTERFRFYFDAVSDGAPSASPPLREVKN